MRARWITLGVAFTLVIAILWALHTQWYEGLTQSDKLSFWVAVGTGCLALVTFASVVETSLVLRGEDVRHQESYAPIVTLDFYESWYRQFGFRIRNTGLGPALRLHIKIDAEIECFERTPQGDGESLGTNPFTKDEDLAFIIHAPGSRDYLLGELQSPAGQDCRIHFNKVSIAYQDVFRNVYETVYADVRAGTYEWVRPKIRER